MISKILPLSRIILCRFIAFGISSVYAQNAIVYVPGNSSTSPNFATVNAALTTFSVYEGIDWIEVRLTAPVTVPASGFTIPSGHPNRIITFGGLTGTADDTLTAILDGSAMTGSCTMMGDGTIAGVYNMSDRLGDLRFTNVKVINANTTGNGSVVNSNTPVWVNATGSVFDDNHADGNGGLFFIRYITGYLNRVTFTNCNLRKNTAFQGGVAYLQYGGAPVLATFNGCNVISNKALNPSAETTGGGGVIWATTQESGLSTNITFINGNLIDNSSLAEGGAFYMASPASISRKNTIIISQSTVLRNVAKSDGGLIWGGVGYYDFHITSSTFERNMATDSRAGVFYVHRFSNESSFTMDDCNFSNNQANLDGGMLYTGSLGNGSSLRFLNSTFDSNKALNGSGGVLHVIDIINNVQLEFVNATFKNSLAGGSGGVMHNGVSGSEFAFSITNSTFEKNVSGSGDPAILSGDGGVMYLGDVGPKAKFIFEKDTFDGNKSLTGNGGVMYISSIEDGGMNFKMSDLIVTSNIAFKSAGGMSLGEPIGASSSFSITNSIFENNESLTDWGGALIGLKMKSGGLTQFLIENVKFKNNKAFRNGGGLCLGGTDATSNFTCTLTNSEFVNNTVSDGNGAGLYFTNGAIDVSKTIFDGNKITGVGEFIGGGAFWDYSDVEINSSLFINNSAVSGGGAYHQKSLRASTKNSIFINNTAAGIEIGGVEPKTPHGGAAYHFKDGNSTEYYNCLFANNTAGLGGAIYLRAFGGTAVAQVPVPIVNCTFYNNSANAGGILNHISSGAIFAHTAVDISNSIFYNNASPAGSAYKDVSFLVPSSSSVTTSSLQLANAAAYGNPILAGTNQFGNADPGFLDVNNILGSSGAGRSLDAGLHISSTLMIDKGTNLQNPTVLDLANKMRIENNIIDMGAYEGVGSLPVRLVSFTAKKEASSVLLTWTTAMEVNSNLFEVEHSLDAKRWNNIGSINSAGESNTLKPYQYNHSTPFAGTNYYRLKMIDKDDTFAYSRIRSLTFGEWSRNQFFPNPAANSIYFTDADLLNIEEIQLYNLTGRCVFNTKKITSDGVKLTGISPGIYVLKVIQNNGLSATHRIVINK